MPVSPAARFSSGATWKTPKPNCGMVRPSLSEMVGIAELMVLLVLGRSAPPEPYPLSGPIHRFDHPRCCDRRDPADPGIVRAADGAGLSRRATGSLRRR